MSAITSAEIDAIVAGRTVATAFRDRVRQNAANVALRWRNADDSWGEWTWADYADRALRAAAGLRALGVQRGHRVVLMMRNRPEFHVLDTAVVLAGGTPISIYNSSAPEQVEYLTGHCEATIGIVEDIGYLERFLKVRSELPTLAHLGVIDDPDGLAPVEVFTLASLLDHEPLDLDEAAQVVEPGDLATVIYTSGTTGPPKGVMITHYNVAWTVESLERCLPIEGDQARVVSYLPMAHIAERMVSHYQHIFRNLEVTTCPEPGQFAAYTTQVRPQVIFGVPRVWEKIHAAVSGALAADPAKAGPFGEAIAAAQPLREKLTLEGALAAEEQETLDFLDAVAFKPVRELIGLDQCEIAVTGAAPIPAEILSWFRTIGVPLAEIYGMSESSGPMTFEAIRVKAGTVGRAIPGCEVTLADDGEVICRGGNVFEGYLNAPDKTAETLDGDGWLHSGDIGMFDDEGYLKIVDRKKELIITAGGKNISPANIEAALKTIPLVGQACAIGDARPFMSALLVLDAEVAPVWAAQQGLGTTDLDELAEHPAVREEIERGVAEVNQQFNNVERVKKVAILGAEWLPDSEELTPTSKLKRRGIHAKYADVIESIYD